MVAAPNKSPSDTSDGMLSDASEDEYLSAFEEPLQDRPALGSDHEYSEFVGELTKALSAKFVRWTLRFPLQIRAAVSNKRAWPEVPSHHIIKRRGSPQLDGQIQRQELDQDSKYEDDGTVVVQPNKLRLASTRVNFSCPFAVRFPLKYHSCFVHHTLRDMRALIHHIWAVHRRPYYCPICRGTFTTGAQRDEHISRQACTLQVTPIVEGVTKQQMQLIGRRAQNTGLSERDGEQWLIIYGILFPNQLRPVTGYVPEHVESAVYRIHHFWDKYGHKAVSDFLTSRGLGDPGGMADDRSRMAFHAAILERMVDEILGPKWWAHTELSVRHSEKDDNVTAHN
ncbi:hypothetical protein SCUP515_10903 [Seiridium cupressi]